MNPEVSIIIAAYNTEAYISQAIESALKQTEKNIEVIVVDDGSSDDTAKIAKSYSDPRLKVFINSQNFGQNYSLNYAIKKATGKWIATLDSDDWFAPERLEKLLHCAYAEKADMIADDLYLIRDKDSQPWSTLLSESKVHLTTIKHIEPIFLLENDVPGHWGFSLGITKPIFKRDFIIHNRVRYIEDINFGGDFCFFLDCLLHKAKCLFIPKYYYFYRSRLGSLVTMSQVKRLEEYSKAKEYFLKQDIIKNNPKLSLALSKRFDLIERSRPYLQFIEPFKQGKLLTALMEMLRNPYCLFYLIQQLPRIFLRRWHYYFARKIIN
ncbi:glycosyl transferase family protein [Tolypothrix sp. NIES-4075]|uniref:glycosyltransferase family 2 protein n=1 Tax=Tolypothrix sp. NIES-4075 TaxID=2005459 RepID=UPI000B5C30B1|nr:glycosyltransferase family 2 protein [Tolypothrix sp. NIES-4075]GAX42393.1 glycosyl transferase family protein [Tolypothrix sp. NIES-4075]